MESATPPHVPPFLAAEAKPSARPLRVRSDWRPLYVTAAGFVAVAAAWYLLKELAPVFRPLLLAIFLCYVILPLHIRLSRRVHPTLAVLILAGGTLLLVFALGAMIYGNVISLNDQLPRLLSRAEQLWRGLRSGVIARLPSWLTHSADTGELAAHRTTNEIRSAVLRVVNSAAQWFGEFVLLSLYLIFLLAEARHLPRRIHAAFQNTSGMQILEIGSAIASSMSSYLRVKALASLILAVPAALTLWLFGVPFVTMWAVLIFLGNFIPYVGSLFAFVLPIALAFLELEPLWKPLAVATLLTLNQVITTQLVEPRLTAKALDMSAVVVLAALTFWGLCWGITGMFLAVPICVMVRGILAHIPLTRPLAKLVSQQ